MLHKISAKSLNDFGKTAGKDLWAWKVQKKHKYINSNLSHYICYYSWLAVQNIDPPSLQKKKRKKQSAMSTVRRGYQKCTSLLIEGIFSVWQLQSKYFLMVLNKIMV